MALKAQLEVVDLVKCQYPRVSLRYERRAVRMDRYEMAFKSFPCAQLIFNK